MADKPPGLARCLLAYGLGGPMIGWLIMCCVTMGFALLFGFLALPIAYVLGGPAALAAGAVHWIARRQRLQRRAAIAAAACVGAAASPLPVVAFFGRTGLDPTVIVALAVTGAVAAGVCGFLVDRRPVMARPLTLANFTD